MRGVNLRLLSVTMGPPRVNKAPEEGREEGKRDLPAHLTICFHHAHFLLVYEYCTAKKISRLDGEFNLHQALSNLSELIYSNALHLFVLILRARQLIYCCSKSVVGHAINLQKNKV